MGYHSRGWSILCYGVPLDLRLHSCYRGVTGPKNLVYMYIYICLYSKLNSPLESHDWGHDLVTSGLSRSVGFGRPVVEPLAYETSPAFGYFTIRRRKMMRRLPCTPCIYHPLYCSISFPLQTRSHAGSFKLSLKHSIWVFFLFPPPQHIFLVAEICKHYCSK